MERTKMLVVWQYTDGRHPPTRTMETSAAKLHEIIESGAPLHIHMPEHYEAWCTDSECEPLTPAVAEKSNGAWPVLTFDEEDTQETPEEPADEPQGEPGTGTYTWTRSGAWYEILGPDGEYVGKVRGADARDELIAEHKSAESAE